MAKSSSQKFIARNRAPRVQIEYDIELYGAQKKVNIPFVMGVMTDLSGAGAGDLPPVDERKALEIDVDNFNDRLESIRPTVSFAVPNTLTGEGRLGIEMQFRHLDDFSPAAIARHVEPLAKLLEARTQLANLGTYLDGKASIEKLVAQAIRDPALLATLAATRSAANDTKED
ncbi:type VI secretion system protein ImpB [Luteibacter sp. Sphag1AF]|uniref:type VI secretion system contractile sheath small subunit n=1 Tax=Luteibacter sp. Sphag1AF TaxID=2587031 RepID=UPI001609765D|nr:type VI secretion system contractile sheath small subunit [Luteibacter sp. Sphag1AF]MBB3228132.1 type VI secretion system protein ImpB [Luteibacter sp. Sphag1AF]